MKIRSLLFLLLLVSCLFSKAQTDSIYDQGVYRTFIVHLPKGYSSSIQYPLVLNFHGLNSNAAQQQFYSQFDPIADTTKMIVVYPNALAGNWAIAGATDVNFVSHLIDTIRAKYSCNSCLFLTGMSQGGFLSYKLVCELSKPITAVAVVSGNMSQALQNTCVVTKGIPVMHFHGTADFLVSYNGTFGIPTVPSTMAWWVGKNNCNTSAIFTAIPNKNLADSSTVEKYYYGGGKNGSEVTFYKILNGGHTWPGAPLPIPFGFTNADINASSLIGNFFKSYCSALSGIKSVTPISKLSVYPNPAQNNCIISFADQNFDYRIYDISGREIIRKENIFSKSEVDISGLNNSIFLIRVNTTTENFECKLLINR